MSIEHKTPNQIISQVSDEVAEMVARWDGSFYEHTTQDEVASMFHHFLKKIFMAGKQDAIQEMRSRLDSLIIR